MGTRCKDFYDIMDYSIVHSEKAWVCEIWYMICRKCVLWFHWPTWKKWCVFRSQDPNDSQFLFNPWGLGQGSSKMTPSLPQCTYFSTANHWKLPARFAAFVWFAQFKLVIPWPHPFWWHGVAVMILELMAPAAGKVLEIPPGAGWWCRGNPYV